jgi:hypothetical protein
MTDTANDVRHSWIDARPETRTSELTNWKKAVERREKYIETALETLDAEGITAQVLRSPNGVYL